MTRDEIKDLFPALNHAANPDNGWWRPTLDCQECPYASTTDRHPGADPQVDYVMCNLLKKRMWTDTPECEERQWQEKAAEELEEVARHLPELKRIGPVVRR